MAENRKCGTCRWLHIEPDKAGRRIVRHGKVYRCQFVPAWPALPVSITRQYQFRLPEAGDFWMEGSYGSDCPTWEPREHEKAAAALGRAAGEG